MNPAPSGQKPEVTQAAATLIYLHAHTQTFAQVHNAFVTHFESFISRRDEQELLLRAVGALSGQCWVSSMEAVRVVFPGQLTVRAADLRFGRVSAHPEHVVTDLRAAVQSFNQR